MNLPKREIKNILHGDDARAKLISGAQKMAAAVGSTYGPAGNNVILGMPYGDATLTRDGVTVAKRVILEDRAEDNAAQILKQASEKTNKTAGDGTTATIVLGYNLFNRGNRLVAAGENGMLLKKQIIDDSRKIIDFLTEQATDAGKHLLDVATVSAGDPAIGKLVADTLEDIGSQGGISIREQNYPTVDVEKVAGYLFDRGFFALNQQVEYANPLIFVSQKRIDSDSDMVPLLDFVLKQDNKNLIIIGDVPINSQAINTLILNVLQAKLNAVVIPPPAFNDEATPYMEDIATYTGAKLYLNGVDMKLVDKTYFGSCERAQINSKRAILFHGSGSNEDIKIRSEQIKDSMSTEVDAHAKDTLEQRYAKLTGKIAIVNVGGSTQTEMEELRYRVEDAIEATKSAMEEGILPGGATMLVRATSLDISRLFKDALEDTFRHLMNNAAERADYRLEQVRRAKDGFGFNLRDMTDEPIDLRKAGIWDATRAVTQTVENATSAAASLLTVGSIVDPIDQKENHEND